MTLVNSGGREADKPDIKSLIERESAGGQKATLPGPGEPSNERPDC